MWQTLVGLLMYGSLRNGLDNIASINPFAKIVITIVAFALVLGLVGLLVYSLMKRILGFIATIDASTKTTITAVVVVIALGIVGFLDLYATQHWCRSHFRHRSPVKDVHHRHGIAGGAGHQYRVRWQGGAGPNVKRRVIGVAAREFYLGVLPHLRLGISDNPSPRRCANGGEGLSKRSTLPGYQILRGSLSAR